MTTSSISASLDAESLKPIIDNPLKEARELIELYYFDTDLRRLL